MSVEPKRSDALGERSDGNSLSAAATLAQSRAVLFEGYNPLEQDGSVLRAGLTRLTEEWLQERAARLGITSTSGYAIVAVGALGRREMVAHSDLDLILIHDSRPAEAVSEVADGLWYPIWDARVGLDHSVRTVPEAVRVARTDITAALGLLDARHIAGDEDLSSLMISSVRNLWRREARIRLDEVLDQARLRWRFAGDIAHRAEPDLKNGRGGLRDVQLLNALALAQLNDGLPMTTDSGPGSRLAQAYTRLLDVRTELHRIATRPRDQVQAQDADEIAAALGLRDRFELARMISDSARTTAYAVDAGLRTATRSAGKRGLARWRKPPLRRPLDEGVVEHDGEVVLARSALPSQDPGLVLRVASASARTGLPVSGATLERLAEYAPPLPEPWSAEDLGDLLVLLSTGEALIGPVEALDRTGLWGRMFPEWSLVRDLPPRDAIHVWTVDRHQLEAVAQAGALTTSVSRPDLLLLGALLHDIGKGCDDDRDHCVSGAELIPPITRRLGLWPDEARLVEEMVRHHLLLPAVATRRNLDDPRVISDVAEALDHDRTLTELLGALAEADSRATGPGVWGEWKASLIATLVQRVLALIGGDELTVPEPVCERDRLLAEEGGYAVRIEPGDGPRTFVVTMVAPDRPGLLAKMAGLLALADLDAQTATVHSHASSAVNTFTVVPAFGDPADPQVLRQRLIQAAEGRLDVAAALDKRDAERAGTGKRASRSDPGVPVLPVTAPARVQWLDVPETRGGAVASGAVASGAGSSGAASSGVAVLQVRAVDRPGLLARVTAVVERQGADVAWARVTTLGGTVIDTFGLHLPRDTPGVRDALADAVRAVCP